MDSGIVIVLIILIVTAVLLVIDIVRIDLVDIGTGYLEAIAGGFVGIALDTYIFAVVYPKLKDGILKKGDFGDISAPGLLKVNDWVVVVPAVALIVLVLFWIEKAGC